MRLYGIQDNANPILLEVVSAEIDIFNDIMIFKTATGETQKIPYTSLNDAKEKLIKLYNNSHKMSRKKVIK